MRPAILLCGMKSQLQVLPLTKERLTGSPPILEYAPSMKKREIKHCQVWRELSYSQTTTHFCCLNKFCL